MSYQTKTSIILLLQSAWQQTSTLDWDEDKKDELQDAFDKLLSEINEKMKDVKLPEEVASIDPERKKRRKEKEKKEKK